MRGVGPLPPGQRPDFTPRLFLPRSFLRCEPIPFARQPHLDGPADLLTLGDSVTGLDGLEAVGEFDIDIEVVELPHIYKYIQLTLFRQVNMGSFIIFLSKCRPFCSTPQTSTVGPRDVETRRSERGGVGGSTGVPGNGSRHDLCTIRPVCPGHRARRVGPSVSRRSFATLGVNVMNVVNVFPPSQRVGLECGGGRNLVHHVHDLHHATADRRHQRPASPATLAAMAVEWQRDGSGSAGIDERGSQFVGSRAVSSSNHLNASTRSVLPRRRVGTTRPRPRRVATSRQNGHRGPSRRG